MQTALTTFLFLAVVHFSHAQIFYNKESCNLRYAGAMQPEVFELLTQEEKTMYEECIAECGVKPEDVIWITKRVYDRLINPYYYRTKMVYRSTSNRIGGTKNRDGIYKLKKPQFMVFIDRFQGEFEVVVQMYY